MSNINQNSIMLCYKHSFHNLNHFVLIVYYSAYLRWFVTAFNNSCSSKRNFVSLPSSPWSALRPFPKQVNTCPTLERSTLTALKAVYKGSIRGNAISEAIIIKGRSQFPKPPITIGITIGITCLTYKLVKSKFTSYNRFF